MKTPLVVVLVLFYSSFDKHEIFLVPTFMKSDKKLYKKVTYLKIIIFKNSVTRDYCAIVKRANELKSKDLDSGH